MSTTETDGQAAFSLLFLQSPISMQPIGIQLRRLFAAFEKGTAMIALSNSNPVNRRRHVRFVMPHQYTAVTVHRSGDMAVAGLEGHVYDISESGIRLELDEPLEVGSEVIFQVQLPLGHGPVTGTATVVWVNDADDDPGPRRCALQVRDYLTPADHARLLGYIGEAQPSRAA